jgi:SpoVK/Ycf46/Vps4 family AAA+-type ATPase
MNAPEYTFLKEAGRLLNSGQTRSLLLTGNIYDIFDTGQEVDETYTPLLEFLLSQWEKTNHMLVVYEINGPIRFVREQDEKFMRNAWTKWRTGYDSNDMAIQKMLNPGKTKAAESHHQKNFDDSLRSAIGNPTVALEMMRQMCLCSRTLEEDSENNSHSLLFLIEAADLILPQGEIGNLSDADRHRVSICHDWFSDPGFCNSNDGVVLLAESRSLINTRVAQLPHVLEVEIDAPTKDQRKTYLLWFKEHYPKGSNLKLWSGDDEFAEITAGLTLQALQQLLKGAVHSGDDLDLDTVIDKVEKFICSQLTEDMIEFKKPSHSLDDTVGFTALKKFLKKELIPRFRATDDSALPGAAVCGPIGGGKTFLFEAVATELNTVVLVLKNIRSQWYGQTDVLFERLRRVLAAMSKAIIFVDEADSQFGGIGPETHATERRLTGKIQSMMSDPQLRGRVVWLLMTARIHHLSPDIRRPGRVGDLIIPILDPEGEDRQAFTQWMIDPVLEKELTQPQQEQLAAVTQGYSAASFAALRSELKAQEKLHKSPLDFEAVLAIIDDHIPPAITQTRRYQTLQALTNCTRKSLLPDPNTDEKQRNDWQEEIKQLEAQGIH